jgi:hypothetical protein
MELTVLERLMLLSILPQEGDFTTLKIIRNLKEELSFSEEEHKKLNFRQFDGKMEWDLAGDENKDVAIGEKATDVIVACLKKINDEKKLNESLFSLYEKFVEC